MDGEFDLKFDFGLLAELAPIDEFLVNKIDGITLLQVCETLECENAAFEGLLDLSLTPNSAGCGALDVDGIKTGAMDVDCKDSASTSSDSRFGQPVSNNEIFKLIKDQENVNTKNNKKWAMNLFEKWRANRRENIPDFKLMTTEQMRFWLGRFVMEVRKRNGTEYPPKSIYLILCGLLRYLIDNGAYDKNFFDDKNGEFTEFIKLVDAKMKSLIDKGFGCSLTCSLSSSRSERTALGDLFSSREGPQRPTKAAYGI